VPHRLHVDRDLSSGPRPNIDTHKRAHVRIESGDGFAEFWLSPVRVKEPGSYNDIQRARAGRIVEQFEPECIEAWERVHGGR